MLVKLLKILKMCCSLPITDFLHLIVMFFSIWNQQQNKLD